MGKSAFKYIGICMGIYLALSFIEVYLLKPLIKYIGSNYWTYFTVYTIALIIVNPIITYILANLCGFKKSKSKGY